jgi:hypothetical protein
LPPPKNPTALALPETLKAFHLSHFPFSVTWHNLFPVAKEADGVANESQCATFRLVWEVECAGITDTKKEGETVLGCRLLNPSNRGVGPYWVGLVPKSSGKREN